MINPDKRVDEALSELKRTSHGEALIGWVLGSLQAARERVEHPGAIDRDFHAGAASELADFLSHLNRAR